MTITDAFGPQLYGHLAQKVVTEVCVGSDLVGAFDQIGYGVRDDALTIVILSSPTLRFTISLDPRKLASCRTQLRRRLRPACSP